MIIFELGSCYEVHTSNGNVYRFKFCGADVNGMLGKLQGTSSIVNIEHVFRPSFEKIYKIPCSQISMPEPAS